MTTAETTTATRGTRDSLVLRVETKREVSDGVVELVLVDPQHRPLPAWTPGAHLDVCLPEGLRRQYSLCGSPAQTSHYRLAVLREPDSLGGSAHIHDSLAAGDTLEVSTPKNNFALAPAAAYRFLAGGVGITPIMPMLEAAEQAGADWSLAYLGRTRVSMAFADELAQRYPGKVTIRPDDECGAPDVPALIGESRPGKLVYACGPEGLLSAVESAMRSWPARTLHVERFSPKETEALPAEGSCFRVKLATSHLELDVPTDKSIVDAAEEAGIPVIYSCLEGTCGTCETPVLSGEVDHRDSILTEEEQAANDVMMICVSRAKSPVLEIDL